MTRSLHDFPGGLKLETWKTLTNHIVAEQHPLPSRLILPVRQHIGMPSVPVVRTGDHVLKGQLIAAADGYVSVPLHASTSGTIIDIGDYPVPHAGGHTATCIVIEPDGLDAWYDIQPVDDYLSMDPATLQEVIRQCGIAGLGGAGFPAHVKLHEGVYNEVDTLIINGVECEPYITCDSRLIQEKAHYIVAGTRMIRHAVQARHCVIALEDDMPRSWEALSKWIDDDIELVKVPTRYPAGGEKQLIQTLTGRQIPSGGLAIHIGIVMHNVATAAAVYRAVTRGEPVISRYVTVTGKVPQPRNLQVLIGTPVRDVLRACGYEHDENHRLILGGPMMGIHLHSPDIPVIKTTNCLLVDEVTPPEPELPCIRCDDCHSVCPISLMPQELYRFARNDDLEDAQQYRIFDCIECGCCSYVCPSRIPLVQYFRYGKSRIAEEERRRDGADHARRRFLQHNARLEADRTLGPREERAAESAVETTPVDEADRLAYIRAAVARTRARRERSDEENDDED